jgi:hypothetical protein
MREFAREARDFLDAHAARREEDAQFRRAKSAELLFGGPPSTTSDSCDG